MVVFKLGMLFGNDSLQVFIELLWVVGGCCCYFLGVSGSSWIFLGSRASLVVFFICYCVFISFSG